MPCHTSMAWHGMGKKGKPPRDGKWQVVLDQEGSAVPLVVEPSSIHSMLAWLHTLHTFQVRNRQWHFVNLLVTSLRFHRFVLSLCTAMQSRAVGHMVLQLNAIPRQKSGKGEKNGALPSLTIQGIGSQFVNPPSASSSSIRHGVRLDFFSSGCSH